MFDGWVGVHKIKSFNIVTVHGWVSSNIDFKAKYI